MKVFISWSGDKSRSVALALADWLPGVINVVEPFVSAKDIYAGSRWQFDIATQLDETNFGIVCVTRDNQLAPWLNFEAGALAKSVDSSRVAPLAIDLKPSDVQLPLGQFQAQPATKDGIEAIVRSLNGSCPSPLDETRLSRAFATWWPQLEDQLREIEATAVPSDAPIRSDRELLEEILNTVRSPVVANVGPPPRQVSPLRNHPVLGELEDLLTERGMRALVLVHGSERKVGVQPYEVTIPDDVQDLLRTRAGLDDVELDFLPPLTTRPLPLPNKQKRGKTKAADDT
jgi:TIR domain